MEIPVDKVRGDLKDPDSLAVLVQDADIVIHLGALISIRGNKTGELFDINVEGTRRICEAAHKAAVRRFIHFSSIHALVHSPYHKALDESRPLAVADKMAYSRSKAAAEEIVLDAVRKGLDAVILSPTAVIGPYDYGPSLTDATIAAIEKGKNGKRYLLSGHWRSLEQISDLVSRITEFRPPRKFTCPHWMARIGLPFINLYCSVYEKEPLYTHDSLYTLRTSHKNISHKKAAEELGFNPRPFEETLRDTLHWFHDQGFLR